MDCEEARRGRMHIAFERVRCKTSPTTFKGRGWITFVKEQMVKGYETFF